MISKEIENHLHDQIDAYIFIGDDEVQATEKAIVQMGDPVSIGEELDMTHRPKPQWGMIGLTICFIIIGFFINLYCLNQQDAYLDFKVYPYILAIALLVISYFVDFRALSKYPKLIYFIVLIVSILGLIFNSSEINGKTTWFIGFNDLSISNLYLFYPFVFALFIYSMRGKGILGVIYSGLAYLPFAIILQLSLMTALFTYTLFSDNFKPKENNDFKINTKRIIYENGKLVVNFR